MLSSSQSLFVVFPVIIFFLVSFFPATQSSTIVPVGQVLDLNSNDDFCISTALSDFYSDHSSYSTRLSMFKRNYTDPVGALSGALDLLKNVGVDAIVGPRGTPESELLAALGQKCHVPILSFSTTHSPTPSNPYFLKTALDDAYQVNPVVDFLQASDWYEVVIIHEDTESGNAVITSLMNSLQNAQIRVTDEISIAISDSDELILDKLENLKNKWTRVFLVHMGASFGSRFFSLVEHSEMMKQGYAWIVTDGLSNSLDALDPKVTESMQGALGIRPRVPVSEKLDIFMTKWKNNISSVNPAIDIKTGVPSLHCLRLYDAVWALALAAERITEPASTYNTSSFGPIEKLKVSKAGSDLLNQLVRVQFGGLMGEFKLVNGRLQPVGYEIVNMVGRGIKQVGFWSPGNGLSELKTIIWPGDSTKKPVGWTEAISVTGGDKLKIAVPYKKGFYGFVNMTKNPNTNRYGDFRGFSIDVFRLVWSNLTYKVPYEFTAFVENETETCSYDNLVCGLKEKKYDIAVGDITIRADRTSCAEFTLPYLENGINMLVKKTQHRNNDMWIFVHPLSSDLWITIIVLCLFIGVSIVVLERKVENRELGGSAREKLTAIFLFPFQAIMIPQRDSVVKNCSRFVLVLWLFLAFVLMQSYTANLSSMLVVDQLKPSYPSVKHLKDKGYAVGYHTGSFVEDFLVDTLGFDRSKVKPYDTVETYHKALSDGPKNGGVAAIFDETPYLKVFLERYGSSDYTIGGPKYNVQGFGFAFQVGSPLVSDFSRAILHFYEGNERTKLTKRYFGRHFEEVDSIDAANGDAPSLTTNNFGGLFLLVGVLTVSTIVVSEMYLFKRLKDMITGCSSHSAESSDGSDGADACCEVPEEANVKVNMEHLNKENLRESS